MDSADLYESKEFIIEAGDECVIRYLKKTPSY